MGNASHVLNDQNFLGGIFIWFPLETGRQKINSCAVLVYCGRETSPPCAFGRASAAHEKAQTHFRFPFPGGGWRRMAEWNKQTEWGSREGGKPRPLSGRRRKREADPSTLLHNEGEWRWSVTPRGWRRLNADWREPARSESDCHGNHHRIIRTSSGEF